MRRGAIADSVTQEELGGPDEPVCVPAAKTTGAVRELLALLERGLPERWVPPLLALAAFNLDFLCVHPFRDGNGRVSRLLLLLQSYYLGIEVGRYISLERLIEQTRTASWSSRARLRRPIAAGRG